MPLGIGGHAMMVGLTMHGSACTNMLVGGLVLGLRGGKNRGREMTT